MMTKKQLKELRVESLLTAAVEEFLEKGYAGASVDAIAKRAGVSKGGVYHHFPNKEALLMEANQKLSEPVMEMAERAYLNSSVMEGLRQYIKEYLNYWVSRPRELSFFFLSMSKALEAPALMEYYREYVQQSTAFFVGMFQKAVESGESELTDPEAYGISLMGALDGFVSYAMIHPEEDIQLLAERCGQVWLK
ncbi:TetR/AcrR family transcriptional regulator [Paenibacillus sonchi]|nr:TetR/AcrR family transcriptional regulator [Paenibacillus sonchi]